MVDKKKELSDKDLKKATGGAMAAGTEGGTKHGGKRHSGAGYVGDLKPEDGGNIKLPASQAKKPGHIRPV
jgi:hypothetical protein